jgi:hypothetical protein
LTVADEELIVKLDCRKCAAAKPVSAACTPRNDDHFPLAEFTLGGFSGAGASS